jgi:HK97 family phage major capsid protein
MILPLITRTSYKGGASIPTSSLKPVATWVAEGAGSDKQNLATGNINFQYFKLRCAVAITLESYTVSLEIFENMLIQNIIEAMTKALEIAVINGDGNGKPTGILAATVPENQDIFTLENSADFETLINAEAAVPIEYDNSAVWFMSKKTFNSFASITDSSGQLVIKNGYDINGKPERSLLGRHVVLTPYLPSLSASTPASTVFAFILNPKDYVLNTNYQLTLKKYEDNDTDDIINKAVMLVDGKLTDNSSLVTVSTPASA